MLFLWILIISAGICLAITTGNCLFWPRVGKSDLHSLDSVSVLIPARNEANNLPACLETVLEQGSVIGEILIYDDHSADNTPQIIKAYCEQSRKVKLVPAVSLPSDWSGKNFACAQLAKAAKREWVLFLDADARLTANAVNRMLSEVQIRQVTFLSCWPKLEMYTLAEKLLMPLLNFVVFSMYPGWLALIKRPEFACNPGLGLAHGACMLFERKSYEQFGGHGQVKDEIFEDTRIAQRWRADGKAGACLDGQDIIYLRMYSSFREIWSGFQKNFFPAFSHEYNFWLFLSLHSLIFLYPFIYLLFYKSWLPLIVSLLVLLTRLMLVIRFRHSLLSVLFHPLGEFILILLGLSSWWRCKTGRGVVWKGRTYQKSA